MNYRIWFIAESKLSTVKTVSVEYQRYAPISKECGPG